MPALTYIRRHESFSKDLGLAKNILAARLRNLVAQTASWNVVPASDGSAYQEIRADEKGRACFPHAVALSQLGRGLLLRARRGHVLLVDRKNGLPVRAKLGASRQRRGHRSAAGHHGLVRQPPNSAA